MGGDSPLYARVCELVAETPMALALAARSQEATPMVFLAAVHDELLRDPDDELADYYPTLGGSRAPDAGLGTALARFSTAREAQLAATLASRRTQTNETARCAGLLPAFAAVAGGRPLAQIEIGASAGLNGLWDHYGYDYAGRVAGDAGSPLRIACEVRGGGAPPLDPPPVAWRAGIDLSPFDLHDPDDVRWLRACLWPDQPARHARFEAALAVAHEHGPVDVRRGDALALLPGVIESAPAGALVCVFHTADARLLHARAGRRAARAAGERRPRPRLGRRRVAGDLVGEARALGASLGFSVRPGGPGGSRRWPHGPPRRLARVARLAASGCHRGTPARSGPSRRRSRTGRA